MRFLLFFVSGLFSFIFYVFYLLSSGKNIFWEEVMKIWEKTSLSWNLLIESILFLLIWITFVLFFSPLWDDKKTINKEILYSTIFYLFLLIPVYFWLFVVNKIIFVLLIIFIFWDICFRILSNIPSFSIQKTNLRYFWLALNYLSTLSSLFYLLIVDFSYYLLLVCLFSTVFNYQIHKKYSNYISLSASILIILVLIFHLFLKIQEIYVSFFSILIF